MAESNTHNPDDDTLSSASVDSPPASDGIVMVSPPDEFSGTSHGVAVSQGFVDLGFSEVEEGIGSSEGKLVSEESETSVNKNSSVESSEILSGMRESVEEPGLRVWPLSVCGLEMECGKSREKKDIFNVLKVLSEDGDDAEENLDNLSLLDVAKARGMTFPRPRWWPDVDN